MIGVAGGIGANYNTEVFGKGDFKYYYTNEAPKDLPESAAPREEFRRYFMRLRHKWDIDDKTNLLAEY